MKKILSGFLLLSTTFVGKGQNLVPNESFEQHSACPSGYSMLSLATPWYNPALLTPDYFDSCSTSIYSSVPTNLLGFQNAHTGAAYAGVFASQVISQPNLREYIRAQLNQPLQAGSDYLVQFYVNLSDDSQSCINTMGAWISVTDTAIMNGYVMTVSPQILSSPNTLCDTANWVLISGIFTSSGNEEYITIGNFFDDSNCGLQSSGGGVYNWAYYFIDDVSVTLSTGIEEQNQNVAFTIYPIPVKDWLNVQISIPIATGTNFQNTKGEIKIKNILGKEVYRNQNPTSNFKIPTSNFQSGIYLIEINDGKNIYRKKFLKE